MAESYTALCSQASLPKAAISFLVWFSVPLFLIQPIGECSSECNCGFLTWVRFFNACNKAIFLLELLGASLQYIIAHKPELLVIYKKKQWPFMINN